jgi:hypothetical protein
MAKETSLPDGATASGAERRRSDRLAIPVEIRRPCDAAPPVAADDVSGHGLRFTAREPFAEDDSIALSMIFPEPTMAGIDVTCRVVWCRRTEDGSYQAGVRFEAMATEDRRRYVAWFCDHLIRAQLALEDTRS